VMLFGSFCCMILTTLPFWLGDALHTITAWHC
jgi:hypothetical protein